jgi:hypothetical protein
MQNSKKIKSLLFFSVLLSGLYFTGCKPIQTPVFQVFGPAYFPLNKGHAITYRVDSTIYDDFGAGKTYTNSYYMKDVVDSSFIDLQNDLSYVVLRYMRPDSVPDFTLKGSYVVTPNDRRIEVQEENLRYIKLIFPFSTSETWLGNNYISGNSSSGNQWLEGWTYRYGAFGGNYSFENFSCDSIVTVDQNSNVLNKYSSDTVSTQNYGEVKLAIEKYAKNKGMVFKLLHYWKKDPQGGLAKKKGFTAVLNAVSVEN